MTAPYVPYTPPTQSQLINNINSRHLVYPKLKQTFKMITSPGGSALNPNNTAQTTVAMESPWDWVRVCYGNWGYTPVNTFGSISPSAQFGTGANPLDAAGNVLTPIPLTFNNCQGGLASGENFTPYNQLSGNISVLSQNTYVGTTTNPIYFWSDWMYAPSLPRVDLANTLPTYATTVVGSTLPLLVTRTWSTVIGTGANANLQTWAIGASSQTDYASINQGRIFTGMTGSGNLVYTTGACSTVANIGTLTCGYGIAGVQTIARQMGVSIALFGDSLSQGFGTTSSNNNWLFQSCTALSSTGFPIQCNTSAISGQTTSQMMIYAQTILPIYKPNAAIIFICSPNDNASTMAGFEVMWGRAMEFAAYCEYLGIVPIFQTAVPFQSYTTTSDPFRVILNNRLRTMAANGSIPMIDADSVITDGATPQAHILPQYLDATTQHVNDAGHAAIAQQVAIPAIKKLLGI